jgi:hypothetical protein
VKFVETTWVSAVALPAFHRNNRNNYVKIRRRTPFRNQLLKFLDTIISEIILAALQQKTLYILRIKGYGNCDCNNPYEKRVRLIISNLIPYAAMPLQFPVS